MLLAIAKDKKADPCTRRDAAAGLARCGTFVTMDRLVELLDDATEIDKGEQVRHAAARAVLTVLPPRGEPDSLPKGARARDRAIRRIRKRAREWIAEKDGRPADPK